MSELASAAEWAGKGWVGVLYDGKSLIWWSKETRHPDHPSYALDDANAEKERRALA